MTDPSPQQLHAAAIALARDQFFYFVWRVFGTLHPGREGDFVPGWHVQAMCHELDEVRIGANQRLVINVPPRHLKSITVSVAFVAFVLGHSPSSKIIVASYGLDLARKHSDDCRRVMQSGWYREMFPKTRLGGRGNTVDEIRTTRGGSRKAVSIGGAVTGHGADYIIIDDLMKAGDAGSEAELLRAQEYIEGSLLSRFDNPTEGRVVMIAQRLHERDPPGYLLGKGGYRHLNLPAIAEDDQRIAVGTGQHSGRKRGEPLFPERFGLDVLERMRREMGAAVFNCQYQQNPVAPDGSPLRWEWFGSYDETLPRHAYEMVAQSWDTGTSADPRSDYSVCTTWGLRDRKWWLLNVFRDRLDYPDLKRTCLRLGEEWEADVVLIEDAVTGRPLIHECFEQNRSRFRRVTPEHDKETRFRAACDPVSEGAILLPREAPWLDDFRRELLAFPRARYDDQVESFSQMMNWTKSTGFWRKLGRDHPLAREKAARLEAMRRRR
jgi:predicted phage terminase large subunit-like protein